jgi:hypothetical protein
MADRPHTLEWLQRASHDLERLLKNRYGDPSNNSLNCTLKNNGRQGDGGGASMARMRSLTSAVVADGEAASASDTILGSARGCGLAVLGVQERDKTMISNVGNRRRPDVCTKSGVPLMIPFTVVLGLFLKGERIISRWWGME